MQATKSTSQAGERTQFKVGQLVVINGRKFGEVLKDLGNGKYSVEVDAYPQHKRITVASDRLELSDDEYDREKGLPRNPQKLTSKMAKTIHCSDAWLASAGLPTYTDLATALRDIVRKSYKNERMQDYEVHPDLIEAARKFVK